jgi:hypothetical protein
MQTITDGWLIAFSAGQAQNCTLCPSALYAIGILAVKCRHSYV